MANALPGDLQVYPPGQISFAGGDLQEATVAECTAKNGAKMQHTLRKPSAGFTTGPLDVSGSFSVIVPADGPEYDYINIVRLGTAQQFRLKFPSTNWELIGVLSEIKASIAIGEAVKFDLQYIAKLQPDTTTSATG